MAPARSTRTCQRAERSEECEHPRARERSGRKVRTRRRGELYHECGAKTAQVGAPPPPTWETSHPPGKLRGQERFEETERHGSKEAGSSAGEEAWVLRRDEVKRCTTDAEAGEERGLLGERAGRVAPGPARGVPSSPESSSSPASRTSPAAEAAAGYGWGSTEEQPRAHRGPTCEDGDALREPVSGAGTGERAGSRLPAQG